MDANRMNNIFAFLEEIVAKIIKMFEQTKAWFEKTFPAEEETTVA